MTDSAVRITHLPTGIVVSCQNERSQHRNRDSAMKVLKARLYDLKMKEQQAKLDQIGGEKKDIAFGSQIRSYVLHPYQMVKDHRTKEEVGDVNRVLDGDLDEFIKAYLMKKATGTLVRGGRRRRRLAPCRHASPARSPDWSAAPSGSRAPGRRSSMTPHDLQRLVAYHRWANGIVLDAAEPLTAAQLAQPLGGSFGSAARGRCSTWSAATGSGSSASAAARRETFEGVEELLTLADVRARWTAVIGRARRRGRRPHHRGRRARARSTTTFRGDTFRLPIGGLLQHVVNHSTYHRGQVTMSLRLLGLAAPSTDLSAFMRAHPARRP